MGVEFYMWTSEELSETCVIELNSCRGNWPFRSIILYWK